jgi:hypothetical protein
MGIMYLMKIISPRYLLIILFSCFPLVISAQVRIFADEVIEENTDLLVRGTGLKYLKACLWLTRPHENSQACEDLYVRVNEDKTRAKIYLPSVDQDTNAKLVVSSGPYSSDEQEFSIFIKDVINQKEELLKKFQFFTSQKKPVGYSLVASREDEVAASKENLSRSKRLENLLAYSSQDLTFKNEVNTEARKNKPSSKKRTKFRDLFRIKPRHRPPENPLLGDIFVSSSNALCIFMDNTWLKIVGSGECVPAPVPEPTLPKPIPQPKKITI